jgi:hypothetical protein
VPGVCSCARSGVEFNVLAVAMEEMAEVVCATLQLQEADDNAMADVRETVGDGDDNAATTAAESESATAMDTSNHTVGAKRPRVAAANSAASQPSAVSSAPAHEGVPAYVSARETAVQSALRWRKRVRVCCGFHCAAFIT